MSRLLRIAGTLTVLRMCSEDYSEAYGVIRFRWNGLIVVFDVTAHDTWVAL